MRTRALCIGTAFCAALLAAGFFPLHARADAADPANVTAADAARLLREGADGELFASWQKTIVHEYPSEALLVDAAAKAMLGYLTGQGEKPPENAPLALVKCREAPLPADGMTLWQGAQCNLHGAIWSDSPLTNVTVTVKHLELSGTPYPMTASVDIDLANGLLCYRLDETAVGEVPPVNELLDFTKLRLGRHSIAITASSAGLKDFVLYRAEFTVADAHNSFPLQQFNFSDNYYSALRFFGYDTDKFMFNYSLGGDAGRSISTATAWRERYLVDTDTIFGIVHRDALPYFEKALDYLNTSYVRVSTETREGKVKRLISLIGEECGTYVPRFQNNVRYISHHSFGTCVDINYDYYPNMDIVTNHELIGGDVRDHLVYNGVKTDPGGQRYYDFAYTGSYPAHVDHIPKTVINYLLYELAFYRAGFSWGYYYLDSCDGMHFSLSDGDYSRHTSKSLGLRKVFEYCN